MHTQAPALYSPRVLVIEADDPLCDLLLEWLVAAGCRPEHATLGQALEQLGEDPVALVIVDLYLPRARGFATIRRLREAYPGAAIIAMSGQFCAALARSSGAAQELGVRALLVKPFPRDALVRAVREALA